jgi:hypothetical protein
MRCVPLIISPDNQHKRYVTDRQMQSFGMCSLTRPAESRRDGWQPCPALPLPRPTPAKPTFAAAAQPTHLRSLKAVFPVLAAAPPAAWDSALVVGEETAGAQPTERRV